MARRCPKTPKCAIESQEVCITILFMEIDSEESNLIFVIVRGRFKG
jgi:hypothetical protein